jgi:hypothetical protein
MFMHLLIQLIFSVGSLFFTIVGFITSILWLVRGSKGPMRYAKEKMNTELSALLGQMKTTEDKELLAEFISKNAKGQKIQTPNTKPSQDLSETVMSKNQNNTSQLYASTNNAISEKALSIKQEIDSPKTDKFNLDKLLHNANVLLYLGTFLILIAVSIFVSSNPELISGWTKTILASIFCLLFYLSGIGLYLRTTKLKPAGITFTSIGLFTAPLVGLAVYNFGLNNSGAEIVWFTTSLITLCMHIIALLIIKKSYISYLSALTTLSLFLSIVSVLDAPVYWFGWIMTLTSLPMLFFAKMYKSNESILAPFRTSASVFIPLSLLLSINFSFDLGLWQVGINFLFASIFYLTGAWLKSFDNSDEELVYFKLSSAFLPLGIFLAILSQDDYIISLGLISSAVALVLLGETMFNKYSLSHKRILFYLASITIAFATMPLWSAPQELLYVLLANLVLNMYLFYRMRLPINQILGFTAIYIALSVYLGYVIEPSLGLTGFSWVYLVLGVLVTVLAYFGPWKSDLNNIHYTKLFYGLALGLALLFSLLSENTLLVATQSTILLTLSFYISKLEKNPLLIFIPILLSYFASWNWFMLSGIHNDYVAYVYILLGIIWLISQKLLENKYIANSEQVLQAAYGFSWFISLILVAGTSSTNVLIISSFITIALVGISYLENKPEVTAIALPLSFIAILQFHTISNGQLSYSLILLSWGLMLYGLAFALDKTRGNYMRVGGLASVYASTIAPYSTDTLQSIDHQYTKAPLLPIASSFIAGGLSFSEAHLRKNKALAYSASVITLISILRLFTYFELGEIQIYTITIALYFSSLGYAQHRTKNTQNRDILITFALGFLSLPLFGQALNDSTGLYSIFLIIESTALIVLGMVLSYKLVTYWGVGSLVLIVLYQLKDVLLNIPTWAIYGFIGLGMLAGALYLLTKRTDDSR